METLKNIIFVFSMIVGGPIILLCAVIGFLAFMVYLGFGIGWNFVKVL